MPTLEECRRLVEGECDDDNPLIDKGAADVYCQKMYPNKFVGRRWLRNDDGNTDTSFDVLAAEADLGDFHQRMEELLGPDWQAEPDVEFFHTRPWPEKTQ